MPERPIIGDMTWTSARVVAAVGFGLLGVGTARAVEPVALEASRDYLVGASVVSSAGHIGEPDQGLSLRPLWAFQLGRWRLATSRASSLLSLGLDEVPAGVSTVLASTDRWSLNTSLRLDDGRSFDADPALAGLPDVRATVLGRASVGYAFSRRWNWSLSGTQDLLGRDSGLQVSTGIAYRYPVSANTYWDLGLSASWANQRHLQTWYGISPESALATGRAPYVIGSGWEGAQLGWSISSAVSRRWVVFGGLSMSQLLGDVGRSPLVGRRITYGATLGLAYRDTR